VSRSLVRRIAGRLMPSLVWRVVGRDRLQPSMFSGVFPAFEDVSDQRPWGQASYLEASRTLLHECQRGQMPPFSHTTQALLALIINGWPAGTPLILDWAGGTGIRYWAGRRLFMRAVRWMVIDRPELAALSHEVMGPSTELTFTSALPEPGTVDVGIVLVYSSLQYVEDQTEMLQTLARYQARFIVLARLMAHPEASYVTRQLVHGHTTPCKVADLREVVSTMEHQGYRQLLSMEDGIDLTGFFDVSVPRQRRAGMEHLLIFKRTTGA